MAASARTLKLNKYLETVLSGRGTVSNAAESKRFIDGICAQPDRANCIDRLIAAGNRGLDAIQAAIRTDLTLAFLNGHATELLAYLQAPEIKSISGGSYLHKTLKAIVEPPIFWNVLIGEFKAKHLSPRAQQCFCWVLLQLLLIPSDTVSPYLSLAQDVEPLLLSSKHLEVRGIGSQIQNTLAILSAPPIAATQEANPPGGRHDNDFADFRKISVLPTAQEVVSTAAPFLRTSDAIDDPLTEHLREAIYLDSQFRLIREDMISELRDEVQIALGKQKGRKHRGFNVKGMVLVGVDTGSDERRTKWGLVFEFLEDLPQLKALTTPEARAAFFAKKDGSKMFKDQSLTCLLVDGEVVAFPSIRRDESLLSENPPQIILTLGAEASAKFILLKAQSTNNFQLLHMDTALFSFEPILLTLKRMKKLPLVEEILFWKDGKDVGRLSHTRLLASRISKLSVRPEQDVGALLGLQRRIVLDKAQAKSLILGLTQKLSIIQGPPGTGKSFIGALLAKFICDFSDQTILVVCYTNHALDQFLEDLLDVGIPEDAMVRLGGKSTSRTLPMLLRNQTRSHGFSRGDHTLIDQLKRDAETRARGLERSFDQFLSSSVRNDELWTHLEFEAPDFFDAFQIPISHDGMQRVGKQGKELGEYDLLERWRRGEKAGPFSNEPNVRAARAIWDLPKAERRALEDSWTQEIRMEQIDLVYDGAQRYDATQVEWAAKFRERDVALLKKKRIIACTTTAAAKYASDIQEAGPQVVLVEEAAEILESHVITALGPSTEQLVLIGDHKQLRPKVNNYNLTVEKGDGYDLNCSLFERLVVKGYPHQTLVAQHRMRPEISALVRALTYPDLVDAPRTKNRDDIKGLQDNIIFLNHAHPEDDIATISDKRDLGSKSSKQNTFEAQMVLKVVRYLAQQGYGTCDMAVLTPYLGQLQKLREQLQLQGEIDPVLNDLDSFELVQAGLSQSGAARAGKSQLRLATIDNYQGEESDIIVISLTRSNAANDIGFMFSPERVNVLLSRARNGLIMIGNSHTFTNARKGRELWTKLITMLNHDGHVYDGLPVMCQRHPDRVAIIKSIAQFDVDCPDGGCSESCGVRLSCGRHVCPSKCHRLDDHSKMLCPVIVPGRCVKGHDQSRKCSEPIPKSCKECDRKAKLEAARLQKELDRQRKRAEEEAEHLRKMKESDDALAEQQELLRDAQRRKDQDNAIRLKMEELENAKTAAERARQAKTGSSNGRVETPPSSAAAPVPTRAADTPPPPNSSPSTSHNANPSDSSSQSPPHNSPSPDSPSPLSQEQRRPSIYTSLPTTTELSPAEQDWEYRKRTQGVLNPPLDSIMGMVGLESVKKQLLAILDKIDTAKRQNASLKDERFNITFLGNPGTGKTTVARQYGKFLSVVDALSGTLFKEVTGASLAHDGVGGAKQLVADVLNAGGGTIFIDEAYQLTSSGGRHSTSAPTGGPVLDFLLAEMENHRGKIIFIFAGYNKQMETFFEHNPGLPSRVPNSLQFEDYTDIELLKILESRMHARYEGKMKVEDGIKGLYGRIAVRRLGRGRGKEGFGNARALENLFSTITTRQAARLTAERRAGRAADDFLFIREDIIGLEPSPSLLDQCDAWKELHSLIGLAAVKESVEMLVDRIQINYQRDLQEQEPLDMSLNRVFLGSPGTGKTSVAKLYGQILARLGLLSNGEVVVKNPSDFIGQYIGQSEVKTKAILETTKGKVLVIDEAYGLYDGNSGSNTGAFKKSVIDTIVAEVQGDARDDRCVLLLGYKDQMIEMFQNANPGLSRRFAIEQAFNFDDFSSAELLQILELKLKKQNLLASPDGKKVAIERLEREKRRANFGNGGAVDNLLNAAKANAVRRLKGQKVPAMMTLEAQDFDPDYNRASNANDNLTEMFKDVVGCESVVAKLRMYQQVALTKRNRGEDATDLIPTNFVFKGPPGTGKTTTARKMGQVYYDMGFLAKPDVTECSASDLVGQYVGQTGPKTRKVFEAALGQVLFIDEAYRLKNGHFAQEAVDEMVDLLTQDKYKGKIVVILAGYDQDINDLLSVNRGLSSRFPEEIIFTNLSMKQCMQILQKELQKSGISLRDIESSSSDFYIDLADLMMDLSQLPSWGNARDVITLGKKLVALAYQQNLPNLALSPEDAMKCAVEMYTERCSRTSNISPAPRQQRTYPPPPVATDNSSASAANANSSATGNSKSPPPPPPPRKDTPPPPPPPPSEDKDKEDEPRITTSADGRDPGVSDKTWNQLQADKKKAEENIREMETAVQKAERGIPDIAKGEEKARKAANKHASDMAKAQDANKKEKLRKQKEAALRKEAKAKKEREKLEAELKRRRERLEKQRKEDVRVQTRLREMGTCVMGFAWIKQASGYRCAGGTHFVSNGLLGI